MRVLLILILLLNIYSIGSGQECSGPLNLIVGGTPTGGPLTLDYIHANVYCLESNEGSIELRVSGGFPEYTCIWSTGDTTEALYNLLPGSYAVTVTDATNCTKSTSVNIIQQHPLNQDLYLADYRGCGKCYLEDKKETFIYTGIDYMVHVKDVSDGESLGDIEVCLEMEEEYKEFLNRTFLNRSWKIKTSNGKSILRLYFEKEELEDLSKAAGYSTFNPTNLEGRTGIYEFIGNDATPENHEKFEYYGDLKYYQFEKDEDIWYVEIEPLRYDNNRFVHFNFAIQNIDSKLEASTEIKDTEGDFFLLRNPVEEWVEIRTENFDDLGYGELLIYDKLGHILHVEQFEEETIHGKKAYVGNLPQGIYVFAIRFSDRRLTKALKFIKI